MIDNVLKHRQYVREYNNSEEISESLIDSLLQRTWKVTPSKNNFMPYTIHVLGPGHQNYKDSIFQKCLANENKNNNKTELSMDLYRKNPPNYFNIVSCSYLLVFTLRLEDKPNMIQQRAIKKGHRYEAVDETKLNDLYPTASLEVGLFSNTFSALCIEHNIDTSFTLCFPKSLDKWSDIPFVKRKPILLMTVGKGKKYLQDWSKREGWFKYNLRPDYSRIVNFVEDNNH